MVGSGYGNLLEKLVVLLCISYPLSFQTLLAILFHLSCSNALSHTPNLCSVFVFLKGRGVRYQLVGPRDCFFFLSLFFFFLFPLPFLSSFLSFDRGPRGRADVGLDGLA